MLRMSIAALILICTGGVRAQEWQTLGPESQTITSGTISNYGLTVSAFHTGPMIIIKQDAVEIDWKSVEKAAADPKADQMLNAYARLIIAVRDGTWKPLGETR